MCCLRQTPLSPPRSPLQGMVGDSSPATEHMLQHRPACCMQHSHATRQNVLQNMLLLAAPKLLPGRQEERCVLSPEPQARGAKTTRLHVARRMPRVMHWPSQVARAALQCGPGKRGRVAVAAAASTSQTAPLGQEKHCRPRRPSCRQKPVSTPSHCYGGNAAKADARRLPAEVGGAESRTAHRSTRQGCRTSIRAKACRALRVVCRVVRCHVALHDAATCLPCSGRRYDYCQPSLPRAAY
jgi:hypothetical protein